MFRIFGLTMIGILTAGCCNYAMCTKEQNVERAQMEQLQQQAQRDDYRERLLILISYQDDTNYGILCVVSNDRRNAWQDLDR